MPAAIAPLVSLRRVPKDPVREAVDRLSRALPARTDAAVVMDLLEDDLREGLDALNEVEAHFSDVLETLRDKKLSPRALVDAGEDVHVLQQLDSLVNVATQLRRRLSQAAVLMRQG